ncbi:MAG: hypothetical protein IJX62_01575 [Clostridia bacterium]|nr:hypothetical protein [Clostridia bacterium]
MINLKKGLVPFWSDHLIDTRFTDATLSANKPERRDIVLVCDRPYEGNGTDFFTVLKDDDRYRMYYEGWGLRDKPFNIRLCYAESRDGIHWEKPDLGLVEYNGNKNNNILFEKLPDNFTVMKDANPACPPEMKYKAVGSVKDITPNEVNDGKSRVALQLWVASDGIHFERHSIISRGYAYDTQNTLHWNRHTGKYYCYIRGYHNAPADPTGRLAETDVRGILVMESEDCKNWSEPKPLYFGGEDYPLYTNCVSPYLYDDRYYIGFPSRYVQRSEWTKNYDRLCGIEKRKDRILGMGGPRLGLALTDCVFMSSQDNYNWYRFDEAIMTPGIEYGENWVYGDCFPAVGGPVETQSPYKNNPPELSMYVFTHHWMDSPVELVRYVYRRDGFASVKAGYQKKKLITKPFTFEGGTLKLNFSTSARGGMYLRILDLNSIPIEGYSTYEIFGDSLDRIIDFDAPLSALNGRPIKFEFTLSDAEIFSMTFDD